MTPQRQVFGRYETAGLLGRGNYAAVYEAHDPALDATVAVKVLADHHSTDPDIRERFIREARLLRRIGTDRLVAVHDIGERDGQPFMVMECANGGTLRARLAARAGDPPSTSELARLVAELQACLEAVHDAGVVHRDIKPSNVLIQSADASQPISALLGHHERLVLADFGLARELDQSKLTLGGGTDGYMAPEQRAPGHSVDQRADIYAASAVVAEVAGGGKRGATPQETCAALPPPLSAALLAGLATDPADRPQTAGEWGTSVLTALAPPNQQHTAPLASPPGESAPVSAAPWWRGRMGALAALGVAVIVALGLSIGLTGNDSTGPIIVGPTEMTVGQTITLRAEVVEGAQYYWTDWEDTRHEGPELEISARGPGVLPVELTQVLNDEETTSERSIVVEP